MESQPQNPEFRNNPENFHPLYCAFLSSSNKYNAILGKKKCKHENKYVTSQHLSNILHRTL